jgi:4-hydroxy-tetrahydrodipicolinate synthase
MAIEHFRRIADACDLPMVLFQYPASTGLGYPLDTLLRMLDTIPAILAIKDWCADPMLHERHIRVLHALPRPVNILTTHSAWLMASLTMGADGLLSGAGSVVPDLQVALFEAIQRKDLAAAEAVNNRLYGLQQAFYAQPFLDMHNRMKECLVLLGRQRQAVVRPPLMKLSAEEILGLRQALNDAELHPESSFVAAAE